MIIFLFYIFPVVLVIFIFFPFAFEIYLWVISYIWLWQLFCCIHCICSELSDIRAALYFFGKVESTISKRFPIPPCCTIPVHFQDDSQINCTVQKPFSAKRFTNIFFIDFCSKFEEIFFLYFSSFANSDEQRQQEGVWGFYGKFSSSHYELDSNISD